MNNNNDNSKTIGIAYVSDKDIYALAIDKNLQQFKTKFFVNKIVSLLPNVLTQLPKAKQYDNTLPIYIIFIKVSNLNNGIGNLSFDVADKDILLTPYILKPHFENKTLVKFLTEDVLFTIYSAITNMKEQDSNNNDFNTILDDTNELIQADTKLGLYWTNSKALKEIEQLNNVQNQAQ